MSSTPTTGFRRHAGAGRPTRLSSAGGAAIAAGAGLTAESPESSEAREAPRAIAVIVSLLQTTIGMSMSSPTPSSPSSVRPREYSPDGLDLVGRAPVARLWRTKVSEAHTEAQQRRARVLAHPDLAERLCSSPLDYRAPEQWTGFVPPRLWGDQLNTSPQRRALVNLAAEALRRKGTTVASEQESHADQPLGR